MSPPGSKHPMTLRALGGRRLVAGALLGCVLGATTFSSAHADQTIRQIVPPLQDFYTKYVDCNGIPVRSSASVEERALELACGKIRAMLANIPSVRSVLLERGAELHIIGRDELTSDLPEFRSQRGVVYTDEKGARVTIDSRTRGKGGLRASCGEENLLQLPNDRYHGVDTCVHEFSHTIMNNGLTVEQRARIRERYKRAMAAGLWPQAYAATDEMEYWAEVSMWYFGGHGDQRMTGTPPADGQAGLRAYDPEGFALLDEIYRGGR